MADVIRVTERYVHLRVKLPLEVWQQLEAIAGGRAYACRELRLCLNDAVSTRLEAGAEHDPARDLTH